MRTIETIRRFKTERFTIHVKAVEDSDLDLSWDDDGSVRAGLEAGELTSFGVVVTCYLDGREMAEDSIWGNIYRTPRDFMDHIGLAAKGRADGRRYGSYFTAMIHNVCRDARLAIASIQPVKVRAVKG